MAQKRRVLWNTDFSEGFAASGPDARWRYSATGPYVADDGTATTSGAGLRLISSGTNPDSGEPAFVRTLGQEQGNGSGLPGALDHVKWLVFIRHEATGGAQGFDAVPGHELSFESWMSGRTYGTAGHPFDRDVTDPEDDLRLASFGLNTFDPETFLVFDFFLTNKQIYAYYERLPFGRRETDHYAAFSYAVPVLPRSHGDRHHLAIRYDRAAGTVRWLVAGEEVFRLDRPGRRLPSRKYLILDHGGEESEVLPRQLSGGIGLFSLLDAALPGVAGPGLVRLSSAGSFYFSPVKGEPVPQTFLDDKSLEPNRLFGQGAELNVTRYAVVSITDE